MKKIILMFAGITLLSQLALAERLLTVQSGTVLDVPPSTKSTKVACLHPNEPTSSAASISASQLNKCVVRANSYRGEDFFRTQVTKVQVLVNGVVVSDSGNLYKMNISTAEYINIEIPKTLKTLRDNHICE